MQLIESALLFPFDFETEILLSILLIIEHSDVYAKWPDLLCATNPFDSCSRQYPSDDPNIGWETEKVLWLYQHTLKGARLRTAVCSTISTPTRLWNRANKTFWLLESLLQSLAASVASPHVQKISTESKLPRPSLWTFAQNFQISFHAYDRDENVDFQCG